MKNAIIIPARLKSNRLKKKVLIEVNGKTILQYTLENALLSKLATRVIVATEDQDIKRHVDNLGLKVDCIKTPQFNNGTDRVRHIAKEYLGDYDKIINMQADEPLFKASSIDQLFNEINRDTSITSAYSFIDNELDYDSESVVKVVMNVFDMALYFSRSPIPFGGYTQSFRHIGIYGFNREVLIDLPISSNYQKAENLEQLCWLENGYNIKMIRINYPTIGIDVMDDIAEFKSLLG